MIFRCRVLVLFLSLVPIYAVAQGGGTKCTIRVDIMYAQGGHAPARLRVQLVRGMSTMAVTFTNSSGTAEFTELGAGEYHVVVSGDGIETTESSSIEVNDWSVFQSKTVSVKSTTQPHAGTVGQPSVSAADLNAPPKAAKEYEKGNTEMARKNWAKAIEHFNKAIEIYPRFSAAYNNLAVCYRQTGQRVPQQQAFEKAIEFNDRCVPALLNLSSLKIEDGKAEEASALLNKALTVEPNNLEALLQLARLDVTQGQYELAIAAAHKVHSLPHENYAVVHFAAASAFEREGRTADAISELQVFVQEAPHSPHVEAARKAIAGLQGQSK